MFLRIDIVTLKKKAGMSRVIKNKIDRSAFFEFLRMCRCDLINEMVPQVVKIIFDFMVALDRRTFSEHFTKKISTID